MANGKNSYGEQLLKILVFHLKQLLGIHSAKNFCSWHWGLQLWHGCYSLRHPSCLTDAGRRHPLHTWRMQRSPFRTDGWGGRTRCFTTTAATSHYDFCTASQSSTILNQWKCSPVLLSMTKQSLKHWSSCQPILLLLLWQDSRWGHITSRMSGSSSEVNDYFFTSTVTQWE